MTSKIVWLCLLIHLGKKRNAPNPLYTWFYEKLTTSLLLENTFETAQEYIPNCHNFDQFLTLPFFEFFSKSNNQTVL